MISNGTLSHLLCSSPETYDDAAGTDSEQSHLTYHKALAQVFPKSISHHHAASLQDWNIRSRASSLNKSTSVPSLTALTKRTSSDPNFKSTNKVKMTHSKSAPNDAIEAEYSGTESTDSLEDKKRDKKKKKKLLPNFLRKDSDKPKVSWDVLSMYRCCLSLWQYWSLFGVILTFATVNTSWKYWIVSLLIIYLLSRNLYEPKGKMLTFYFISILEYTVLVKILSWICFCKKFVGCYTFKVAFIVPSL